ncbi:MAG: hypothetical protein KJZ64_13620 [Sphingomonadaceae bacterium]|nr:hypothetical protein [Sphingomonadaceae bacterium]
MRLTARQAHLRVALFLGLFLAVHFATHFAGLGGIESHGAMLSIGRGVYRIPVVEALLVTALATQVFLGITLVRRMAQWPRLDRWRKAQKWSGIALAVFIVLHTSAALGSRWLFALDTNFNWAAGTLTIAPLNYGFAPYYAAAVIALVTHVLAALHIRRPARRHGPALLLGPAIALPILLAYGGALFPVELPAAHRANFQTYLDLL